MPVHQRGQSREDTLGSQKQNSEVCVAALAGRSELLSDVRQSDKTAALLETAVTVFAERGYRRTNLKYIAGAHNLTRQALYHYFPTKESILLALIVGFNEKLEASVLDGSVGRPVGDQFRCMVRLHLEAIANAPALAKVVSQDYSELPQNARDYEVQWRKRYQDYFIAAFKDGVRAGVFADVNPSIFVQLILSAGNSLYRWYRLDGPLSPSEFAVVAERLLIGGVVTGQ
jgi:AcrR family transcriptional regulator